MNFKSLAAAAIVAAAPMAASAFTINTQLGITGDLTAGDIGQIDVLTGASFDVDFEDSDVAGQFEFDLNNFSGASAVVTFTVTTINQCVTACGFAAIEDGSDIAAFIDLDDNDVFDGPPELSVVTNETATETFKFIIGAGGSQIFDFVYGDPFGTTTQMANFDFTVEASPIPVPAGILLMGTALAGFGVMRRKKAKKTA